MACGPERKKQMRKIMTVLAVLGVAAACYFSWRAQIF